MSNKLENYIQSHLEEGKINKPDPAILGRILVEMKSGENVVVKNDGILRPLILLKWAAACLFFAFCFLGVRYFDRRIPGKEISKLNNSERKESIQKPAVITTNLDTAVEEVIKDQIITAAFNENVKPKQKAWVSELGNMESAATRINAVVAISRTSSKNYEIIDTLLRVLNSDPNANVRLAAMDGLTRFYADGYAIEKLTASLKNQFDPVIQINLIALLVRKREVGVLPDLERMIKDEKLEKSVKDFAYSGILQLRPELLN
jgi:hypothetical protein